MIIESYLFRMVSKIVDTPVHMDVVMHMDGTASKRFSYTAYMNEKFSINLMTDGMINDNNYMNLSLDRG